MADKADKTTTEAMSHEEEMLRQLEASLTDDIPAWMPNPGEVLSGVVTDITARSSKFGQYPALTIRKTDGEEVVFHAFRAVAKSSLARIRPTVGDLVAILYIGEMAGFDYHGYRIRTNRTSGREFDWDPFDPEMAEQVKNLAENIDKAQPEAA